MFDFENVINPLTHLNFRNHTGNKEERVDEPIIGVLKLYAEPAQ